MSDYTMMAAPEELEDQKQLDEELEDKSMFDFDGDETDWDLYDDDDEEVEDGPENENENENENGDGPESSEGGHCLDKCVCGNVRGRHIGPNDICPDSRADSTESFRQWTPQPRKEIKP